MSLRRRSTGTRSTSSDAANPADFSAIREKAEEYIRSRNEKVREISLNVFGKNDFFFLDVALLYRPVHSQREPGLTLAIGMTPESLHARPGESFDEVSARNAELMTDGPERDQFLARLQDEEPGPDLRPLTSHLLCLPWDPT